MANLVDDDRVAVWREFMSRMGPEDRTADLTKADFRAAVNALDVWVANNAGTINAAIPQPARSALTALEKIGIFAAVATKRFVKEVL